MLSVLRRLRRRPAILVLHLTVVLLWPLAVVGVAAIWPVGPVVEWLLLTLPLAAMTLAVFRVWGKEEARRVEVLERRLTSLAHRDPLTGVPNRRALEARLREAESRRDRVGVGVRVMVIDLDDFKEINDTHGHAVGDDVLRVIGRRLSDLVRDNDFVARLGGDEFVVVAEDVDAPDKVDHLGRRLREVLGKPIRTKVGPIQVHFSIGVADAGPDKALADALLLADQAMYRDKVAS